MSSIGTPLSAAVDVAADLVEWPVYCELIPAVNKTVRIQRDTV